MARPQLKISVPQPCSENWNAMTPQAKGRFCAGCATTVIDFSQFTDQQLLEYFAKPSGKTCGRFTASQLNRPVYAETLPKQNFFPRALAAAALFLGISSQAQAQTFQNHPVPTGQNVEQRSSEEENSAKTVGETPEKVSGDSLVISGKVFDKVTREKLFYVSIFIQNTRIGNVADINGNYEIVIPDTFKLKEFSIEARFIGYNSKIFKVSRKDLPLNLNIEMEINTTTYGEVEITQLRKTPGYYLRSFWWKTKNLFRKNDQQ